MNFSRRVGERFNRGRIDGYVATADEDWSPSQLANLALWLRGDMGITLNGTQVSAWADQSGNGRHFAQASGSLQPTFVSSESDFPTPQAAVKFDQSQDRLDASAKWNVRWVAIVGVYNGATFAAFNTLLGSSTASDPATRRFFIGASGTANWRQVDTPSDSATYTRDGSATNVALTTANAPHLWEASWASDVIASTAWRLGADSNAGNEWTDSVAEIVMAEAIPSAGDLTLFRAYVAARYGFAVS